MDEEAKDRKDHTGGGQKARNKISGVIFFALCVHGFGSASVKTFPESWDIIITHTICYTIGSLVTGFLILRYTDRQVTLIASFLMKSCLMFPSRFVPTGPWSLVLLVFSSLISSCIDVSMTSLILDCWQDDAMDTLLGASAFYSAGFVVSYFCPMGKGFFTLDKIAAILMVFVVIAFAVLKKRGECQGVNKRRLKDGKIQSKDEATDHDVVLNIKPAWKIFAIIGICSFILLMIRIMWFNTIVVLKNFYIEMGFSVHLPLAEVTLRLLMTGSVLVFILVSRIGQVNKNVLVYISMLLIMIGSFFLILTINNPGLMWAALAFLGFGFSSICPIIFCVLEKMMNVTGPVVAVLIATIGFGDIIRACETFLLSSRHSFSTINIVICMLSMGLFFALNFTADKVTQRTIRRRLE